MVRISLFEDLQAFQEEFPEVHKEDLSFDYDEWTLPLDPEGSNDGETDGSQFLASLPAGTISLVSKTIIGVQTQNSLDTWMQDPSD